MTIVPANVFLKISIYSVTSFTSLTVLVHHLNVDTQMVEALCPNSQK